MSVAPSDRERRPRRPPEACRTSLELFTGGGGLALAMHESGFQHLLLNEFNRRAADTLRLNRASDIVWPSETGAIKVEVKSHTRCGWPLIEGDVHKIDFTAMQDQVDVLAGGVPCQPWSLGGVHRGREDERNLWPEFARAARETRPRALLAENVRGLLRPAFAPYWEYTLNCLRAPHEERLDGEDWQDHNKRLVKLLEADALPDEERYDVAFLPVNAADYGVPQVRHRVFVVGFRRDVGVEWKWPSPTHSDSALRKAQTSGEYWDEHGLRPLPVELPRRESKPESAQPEGSLRWRTLRDAIADLPEPLGHAVEHPDYTHHFGWDGARVYAGHTPNLLDRPAKTVKAGVHGVPGGETVLRKDDGSIRYMTVREVARVMTFPDDWRFAGPRGEQMRVLGNAVPVHLGRVMTDAVAKALPRRA